MEFRESPYVSSAAPRVSVNVLPSSEKRDYAPECDPLPITLWLSRVALVLKRERVRLKPEAGERSWTSAGKLSQEK